MSFVSTLHHAIKVIHSGRGFASRMYATAARLHKMHFTTRLNKSFWSNLLWCTQTLQYSQASCGIIPDVSIQADASGIWGCTAVMLPIDCNGNGLLSGKKLESWQRSGSFWHVSHSFSFARGFLMLLLITFLRATCIRHSTNASVWLHSHNDTAICYPNDFT